MTSTLTKCWKYDEIIFQRQSPCCSRPVAELSEGTGPTSREARPAQLVANDDLGCTIFEIFLYFNCLPGGFWVSLGKITNTNSALGPQGTAPEEAGALSCDSPKSKNRIKHRTTTLLPCYIVQAYHITRLYCSACRTEYNDLPDQLRQNALGLLKKKKKLLARLCGSLTKCKDPDGTRARIPHDKKRKQN